MFRIHKETDYALIALYYISQADGFLALSDIVERTQMPQRFLARIAAKLTKHKLLVSKEGRTGGYKLSKSLNDISLYNFLRIFEDDLHVVGCEKDNVTCKCKDVCQHKTFFSGELRNTFIEHLKNTSLKEVYKNSTK